MHVADSCLERPVVGRRVQVAVLAHEAPVVGVALRVARRHADDVPVRRDLLRVVGVEPQRAAAHLAHGDSGRGAREVDEAVHARRVPALAEERARADERPRIAGGEDRGGEPDPAPRPPLAGPAQLDQTARGGRRRSSRWPRPPAPDCRLVGRGQRGQQRFGVLLGAAQPAARDQQRAQDGGAGVVSQRPDGGAGGAGVGVEHVAQLSVRARAGQLGVAQNERAQVDPARLGLGAEHLDESQRLRGRAGQQPVDVGRRAADAGARELEAEVAQRRCDRLAARRGLRLRLPVEAAQHPVLEQHDPIVEVRRAAVGLAARRARRQREPGGRQEAHARARERRMAALEVAPRHLALVLARPRAVAQPRDHPLPEVERPALLDVEQFRDELAEARLVLVEPALLAVERLGQPGQLLVGREMPVAHDRGRGDLEVDRPEQGGVELGLLGRELVRGRRRQSHHVHAVGRAPPAPPGPRSPRARRGGGTRRARRCALRRPAARRRASAHRGRAGPRDAGRQRPARARSRA